VGTNCKNGADTIVSIEALEEIEIDIEDMPLNASPLERRIWEKEVDDTLKRRSILKQNSKSLYSFIWGHLTTPMRVKVESLTDFAQTKEDSDSLQLLQGIMNVVFDIATQNKYKRQTMHKALSIFFKQDHLTNSEYLEKFQTLEEVCNIIGCELGKVESMANTIIADAGEDLDAANGQTRIAAMQLAKQRYQAIAFLLSADRSRFGKMLEDPMNSFLQ